MPAFSWFPEAPKRGVVLLLAALVWPIPAGRAAAVTTFGPQQVIQLTDTDGVVSVFAADLDGDGDQDVLSASAKDDKIAWSENTDGMGTFGPQQVITLSAEGALAVFAAGLPPEWFHLLC